MRPRKRLGGRHETIVEPNMTPLIDVSLVLVVILMVATPLAFQSSIGVNSASSSGRAAPVATRADRIEIDVLADGSLRVNRTPVTREALGETLKPLIESSTTRTVIVRCEDGVRHGSFVSVIDEARVVGAAHIAVVGG